MMENSASRLSLGSDVEVGSLENCHSLVAPRRKNPVDVMEQTNHRQDICLPKTSFSVGILYMYENVEETVVLHVRMYVRNRKYDNLIFLS